MGGTFGASASPRLGVATGQGFATTEVRPLVPGGPVVGWFELTGGPRHGAIGVAEGEAIATLVRRATDNGIPIVGHVDTSGADVVDGVASLHAWGTIARALASASGVVPTAIIVTGACVSGPSLLLGLVDVVVMTVDAFAYVSGPNTVAQMTGLDISRLALGGAAVHDVASGVASVVVASFPAAVSVVDQVLAHLPPNNLSPPPPLPTADPLDRMVEGARSVVPAEPSATYDVARVVREVVDDGWFLELRSGFAPNIVTGLGSIGGHAVGIVANQPSHLAGTIDIAAAQKGARFVQWCDAFNVPIVSFVDTTGFLPGTDLEWRGMIRHGAQLVHAYCAASVPRLCVILRKAYGGAYIVMDSKTTGNDFCVSWPDAEVAVMGAPAAVEILHGRRLAELPTQEAAEERDRLAKAYDRDVCTPALGLARGYIDEVIQPEETRAVLASGLEALRHKRETASRARHSNGPL